MNEPATPLATTILATLAGWSIDLLGVPVSGLIGAGIGAGIGLSGARYETRFGALIAFASNFAVGIYGGQLLHSSVNTPLAASCAILAAIGIQALYWVKEKYGVK